MTTKQNNIWKSEFHSELNISDAYLISAIYIHNFNVHSVIMDMLPIKNIQSLHSMWSFATCKCWCESLLFLPQTLCTNTGAKLDPITEMNSKSILFIDSLSIIPITITTLRHWLLNGTNVLRVWADVTRFFKTNHVQTRQFLHRYHLQCVFIHGVPDHVSFQRITSVLPG